MTVAEMKAEAARLRDEARRLRLDAATCDFMAGEYEDAAAKGLTITNDRAINGHMSQAPNVLDVLRSQRSAGRKTYSKHPFPRALERANLTMTEVATLLNTHRSTVKSWLHRKIPRRQAEAIAKLLPDLPATEKSWPAGIK